MSLTNFHTAICWIAIAFILKLAQNLNTMVMELKTARKLLDTYSCTQVKPVTSPQEKTELQEALHFIVTESDAENLGVCADTPQQGYQALAQYLQAFGYKVPFDLATITPGEKPTYLKCNTAKMIQYQDDYEGDYRGVLVACQSDDDMINGVFGYFPLDLFA